MKYTVNLEEGDDMVSWTGDADDETHAVDLAREAHPDGEVIDAFAEE